MKFRSASGNTTQGKIIISLWYRFRRWFFTFFWIQFKFPFWDFDFSILNIVGSSCILAEKRFISEIFCLDQFFSQNDFLAYPLFLRSDIKLRRILSLATKKAKNLLFKSIIKGKPQFKGVQRRPNRSDAPFYHVLDTSGGATFCSSEYFETNFRPDMD